MHVVGPFRGPITSRLLDFAAVTTFCYQMILHLKSEETSKERKSRKKEEEKRRRKKKRKKKKNRIGKAGISAEGDGPTGKLPAGYWPN